MESFVSFEENDRCSKRTFFFFFFFFFLGLFCFWVSDRLFVWQPAALPDASVYLNDDYFAGVEASKNSKDKNKGKAKEKEKEKDNNKDKKKKKKDTKASAEEKRRMSGTLRDLFAKESKDNTPPRRTSQSSIRPDSISPTNVAPNASAPAPATPAAQIGKPIAIAPVAVSTAPASAPSEKRSLHASAGVGAHNNLLSGSSKNSRSDGDASHIRQLVVKLESDRKTIQVGQPKGAAVERKYTGVSLVDLRF